MKRIKILLLSLLTVVCLQACMKDKGIYDYKEVNRVKISAIDSSYIYELGNRLHIVPKFAPTTDKDFDPNNYTFKWVIDHKKGLLMNPKVISTKQVLDTVINKMDYGSYAMFYRITDKRTGVFSESYFDLNVSAANYEGWMLLCDTEDGNSRLDMVSYFGTKEIVYKDVLGYINSAYKPLGKPAVLDLSFTYGISSVEGWTVIIATDKTAVALDQDKMAYSAADNDLSQAVPSDPPVQSWSGASWNLSIWGGLVKVGDQLFNLDPGQFLGPVNTINGGNEDFVPSPWIAINKRGQSSKSIVFDKGTGEFLRYPGSGETCLSLPKGGFFDFKTGKDLLFMTFVPFNGGEVFAVLKDRNSNKKYLARFSMTGVQNYYGEINGEGINEARFFAVHPNLGYLFYATDHLVYEFDSSLNKAFAMKQYPGRMITEIKFHTFLQSGSTYPNYLRYTELGKKLIVCTYVPGDALNSGQLDLFNVPEINGKIRLDKSYSGLGKISKVCYQER
jgi:hypothetical protein